VNRLLALPGEVDSYQFQNLTRFDASAQDKQAAKERVRQAMHSGAAHVGRIGRLVLALEDGELRAEFLASLASADQARLHYRLYDMEGLIDLLEQSPADEAFKLLPVVVELAGHMQGPARLRLAACLGADAARAAAIAPLAHHRDQIVRDLVRPHLSEDVLWKSAIESLAGDPATACAAASWIAGRDVDAARREQVVAALLPRLWITDGKEYPAIAALGKWGDARNAAALEEVGRSSGAERVAADVCRLLAKWSPERLVEVIKSQLGSLAWNNAAVQAMRDDAVVAGAVKTALRDAKPHDAHSPYIETLFYSATPEDLPWLREYQLRLRGADLRSGPEMDRRLERIIQKQSPPTN
jgi:hypothetical protein